MDQGRSINRRARYDEQGNIVLPTTVDVPTQERTTTIEDIVNMSHTSDTRIDGVQWGLPDEPSEDISALPSVQREHARARVGHALESVRESCAAALTDVHDETRNVTKRALEESERQLRASINGGVDATSTIIGDLSATIARFGRFLTQPVLVPARKKRVKQYSRGSLFALDIVRFGGTFAAIFVVLFSAMNYESFVTIATARIEPLLAFTNLDSSTSVQRSLAEKLRQVPSLPTAGDSDQNLASHLPLVGPPNDIIIIPKINLRAPIVSIPTDSLIREDWKQLETDIQRGLENGVVHYPGTAEPSQPGNVFFTGHSSYFPWAAGNYKSVFARLGELAVGDEIWVYHGGDKYLYVVQSKKEIVPSDVTVLDQPVNKRIATLMTCTPVGTTLRRLIIQAQETDPTTGAPMEVGQHQRAEERPDIKLDALPI